jgi:hypothetical protein
MKTSIFVAATVLAALILAFSGCNKDTSNGIAPYEAQRELLFVKITASATPDVQWLGGRVAAVGINKGPRAALDGSLVWLRAASIDTINSYVTFGKATSVTQLLAFGGAPADSLDPDSTYTFWIATKSAMDAHLDTANPAVNVNTLGDTTLVASYWLKGQMGGEGGTGNPTYRIRIRRDQTILGDKYTIYWTPATAAFRNVALRMGSTGGYDNLLWMVTTSGTADNILPPVVLGVAPSGVTEGTPYVSGSLSSGTVYTLWMNNRNWVGTFALNARGYAFFRFTEPQ